MTSFTFKLITPEKVVIETAAEFVKFHLSSGEIGILPNHSPLFGKLEPGELLLHTTDNEKKSFTISGGYIQVGPDFATAIVQDVSLA